MPEGPADVVAGRTAAQVDNQGEEDEADDGQELERGQHELGFAKARTSRQLMASSRCQ